MASTLHFPNAETMTRYLSNYEELNSNYLQQKGITKAVAELAAERFAGSTTVETGVRRGAILMVCHLQCGRGFSGESVPNLGKLGLPDFFWDQLSISIENALTDCAKDNAKKTSG